MGIVRPSFGAVVDRPATQALQTLQRPIAEDLHPPARWNYQKGFLWVVTRLKAAAFVTIPLL